MERLLIALVVWLFKQLLRLVLLALTGEWRTLDEWVARAKQRVPGNKAGGAVKRGTAAPAGRRRATPEQLERLLALRAAASARAASEGAAFPFEFAPELTRQEPSSEDEAPEPASEADALRRQQALARRRAELAARREAMRAAAASPKRSLARAVRDRKTLRAAVAIGAALGPPRSGR